MEDGDYLVMCNILHSRGDATNILGVKEGTHTFSKIGNKNHSWSRGPSFYGVS